MSLCKVTRSTVCTSAGATTDPRQPRCSRRCGRMVAGRYELVRESLLGWQPTNAGGLRVPSSAQLRPCTAARNPLTLHWCYFRAASPMCGNALLAAIALKLVWCLVTLAQAVSPWMAETAKQPGMPSPSSLGLLTWLLPASMTAVHLGGWPDPLPPRMALQDNRTGCRLPRPVP